MNFVLILIGYFAIYSHRTNLISGQVMTEKIPLGKSSQMIAFSKQFVMNFVLPLHFIVFSKWTPLISMRDKMSLLCIPFVLCRLPTMQCNTKIHIHFKQQEKIFYVNMYLHSHEKNISFKMCTFASSSQQQAVS